MYYQSLRPPGQEDQRPLQFEDSGTRPGARYANRHLREMVDAVVASLSPHHREVFVMRELEGRSHEEISALTRCHLGTGKSRRSRARHAFAERIAPYLD